MRNDKIEQAVQIVIDHETSWSRDVDEGWGIHHQGSPPVMKISMRFPPPEKEILRHAECTVGH